MAKDRAKDVGHAAALLRAAMAVRHTSIPPVEGDLIYQDDHLAMTANEFWFESPGHVRFHYCTGATVTVELPTEHLRGELELYLWGTVYGAVAWYNGLLPLHASAVSRDGSIIAFTADSGGGKSTLAAGLTRHRFAHACDDTLVVLPAKGARPVCLPDGRPLKLWSDALIALPAEPIGPVATVQDKFYARIEHRETRALPLGDLVFLEFGERYSLEPIRGAAKFQALPEAMYRSFIHAARGDRDFHAAAMFNLAESVRFWRLTRPRHTATIGQTCGQIAEMLEDAGLFTDDI